MTLDCDKCHKNFSTETDLYKHLLTHQEGLEEPSKKEKSRKRKSITCNECDKVFHKKSEFQSHMSKHRISHQENDVPKSEENTVAHKKRGRPSTRITSTCQDCNEVFYRRCDLRLHRRMEHRSKKNTCSVCKRSFSNEKRFKMHYQFHNVGGAFQCVYCDKSFNRGWKLKIHLVNHNGRSPYLCQLCGEDFLYPGKIIDHLKREHDMYFSCQDCGVGFRTFSEQNYHACMIYTCKDCNKAFSEREGLVAHIETHNTLGSTVKQEQPTLDVTVGLLQNLSTPQDNLQASYSQDDDNISSNGLKSESRQDPSKAVADVKSEENSVKFVLVSANFSSRKSANKNPMQTPPTDGKNSENHESKAPGDGLCIKSESDVSLNLHDDASVDAESSDIAAVDVSLKSSPGRKKADEKIASRRKSKSVSAPHNASFPGKKSRSSEIEDTKNIDLNSWDFSVNRDTVVKPKPLSLKTWLTSDNLTCVTNDFVFGRGLESDASDITIKAEIKSEKDDYQMSFEALC